MYWYHQRSRRRGGAGQRDLAEAAVQYSNFFSQIARPTQNTWSPPKMLTRIFFVQVFGRTLGCGIPFFHPTNREDLLGIWYIKDSLNFLTFMYLLGVFGLFLFFSVLRKPRE